MLQKQPMTGYSSFPFLVIPLRLVGALLLLAPSCAIADVDYLLGVVALFTITWQVLNVHYDHFPFLYHIMLLY